MDAHHRSLCERMTSFLAGYGPGSVSLLKVLTQGSSIVFRAKESFENERRAVG